MPIRKTCIVVQRACATKRPKHATRLWAFSGHVDDDVASRAPESHAATQSGPQHGLHRHGLHQHADATLAPRAMVRTIGARCCHGTTLSTILLPHTPASTTAAATQAPLFVVLGGGDLIYQPSSCHLSLSLLARHLGQSAKHKLSLPSGLHCHLSVFSSASPVVASLLALADRTHLHRHSHKFTRSLTRARTRTSSRHTTFGGPIADNFDIFLTLHLPSLRRCLLRCVRAVSVVMLGTPLARSLARGVLHHLILARLARRLQLMLRRRDTAFVASLLPPHQSRLHSGH